MDTVESKLKTVRDLLKSKIETKFNTTTNSTTIKDLLNELNGLVPTPATTSSSITGEDLASRIFKMGDVLASILNSNNVTADGSDGFTTLINKIDNIVLTTTPTITLETNKSSLSSGGIATLTATVKGSTANGTPTGKVEFYENETLYSTVTSSTIDGNDRKFLVNVYHNDSSTKTYKYAAKFISTDTSKYNDSELSSSVSVKWTYTAPSPTWTDDNVSASLSTTSITYGQSVKITASGTGSLTITKTTNGGSSTITTLSSSGSYTWTPSTTDTYTITVTSSGNSSSYIKGKTVTAGTVTVSQATGSITLTVPSVKATQTVTVSATGQGKVTIGTTNGGTQISTGGTNSTSGTWTPSTAGNYTIYANSAGNSNYTSSSTSKTVTVTYMGTNISSSMVSMNKGGTFIAYLKDDDGNPVIGRPVNVQISGNNTSETREVTATTDMNGTIKVSPDSSVSWGGKIKFMMAFGRVTNLYNGSNNTFEITYIA